MFKAIFQLFLVFIICITASGIPTDVNTLDFSQNLFTTGKSMAYGLNAKDLSLQNPTIIDFEIQAKNPAALSYEELKDTFVLDVMQNNKVIMTLDAPGFVENTSSHQNANPSALAYAANFSQQHLKLPDGNYTFKLYSNGQALKNIHPLQFKVTYSALPTYIPATNEVVRGMMGLTLYFPDTSNGQYLIPVTRFVKYTRAPLRTIINHLQKGSTSLGFLSPIPHIPKLQVRKNRVIVHLPSDLEKYNQNAIDGRFALESLVYSFTSISGIDQVKFLVDGKESDNLFHGYSTKTIFAPGDNPQVYLGISCNDERVLLVPKDIKQTTIDDAVKTIIAALKTGKVNDLNSSNLIPVVPENVQLINFSHTGDTLILNFNKELLGAYGHREDLRHMMIDAMVFSFTSMKAVEKVEILVEGQKMQSLDSIDLSVPLERPRFINPENG